MGCPYRLIIGWANDLEQLFAKKKIYTNVTTTKLVHGSSQVYKNNAMAVWPSHLWGRSLYILYHQLPIALDKENLPVLFQDSWFIYFIPWWFLIYLLVSMVIILFYLLTTVTIYFQFRYFVVFSCVSLSVIFSTCYMSKLGDFRDLFNNSCLE